MATAKRLTTGDKVKITTSRKGTRYKGKTGTIVADDRDRSPYKVRLNDRDRTLVYWLKSNEVVQQGEGVKAVKPKTPAQLETIGKTLREAQKAFVKARDSAEAAGFELSDTDCVEDMTIEWQPVTVAY